MQALHLMKQKGWKQRDIAVALDVTEGVVKLYFFMQRSVNLYPDRKTAPRSIVATVSRRACCDARTQHDSRA